MNTIPGLIIHEHEGRFTGTVDMPPADLAAVSWNGRAMLVVMADVGAPGRITTDKEGTNKAHWTYSVVDAAIVRDEGMRQHLERSLHVDAGGVEPHVLEEPAPVALEIDPTLEAEALVPTREALGDDVLDEEYEGDIPTARIVEDNTKKPLFSTPQMREATRQQVDDTGPEVKEVLTGPIRHKDARLQAFLDNDREGR